MADDFTYSLCLPSFPPPLSFNVHLLTSTQQWPTSELLWNGSQHTCLPFQSWAFVHSLAVIDFSSNSIPYVNYGSNAITFVSPVTCLASKLFTARWMGVCFSWGFSASHLKVFVLVISDIQQLFPTKLSFTGTHLWSTPFWVIWNLSSWIVPVFGAHLPVSRFCQVSLDTVFYQFSFYFNLVSHTGLKFSSLLWYRFGTENQQR